MSNSFNISTAASIIASASGINVAKHGIKNDDIIGKKSHGMIK
ncbi:MAG: hypothetical protein E6K94_01510 [Thaumarchaeota archaeon]|nr:MAG: hypothetical protein E6L03_08165 [Nitrososphaerota archaeon]TLX85108.1 MAG: hypothetical protein E6L01_06635 [Nitrososphaerota archaeon]TLX91935.1 MAG: hypothetical protein E6K94_01510 [Nitrososphaerota archaeon]